MRDLLPSLALCSLVVLAPNGDASGAPSVGRARGTASTARPRATVVDMPDVELVPPKFVLDVQIVRTADDDGGRPSVATRAQAENQIAVANAILRRNGGDVALRLHAASNFDDLIESTALNRDCILAPGQTEATINANTDGDVDNNGTVGDAADRDALCDYTTVTNARTAYAIERADRIIVYSRGGDDAIKWDGTRWVFSHPTGGNSWGTTAYVRMPQDLSNPTLLAHEIGHYLHNQHTFDANPQDSAEARAMMEQWIADHPGDDPRGVFDADSRGEYAVHDTPPDPRKTLLKKRHGGDGCDPDPAKGTVTVRVTVDGQETLQVLTPDRSNIMSYFKGCSEFAHRFSKEQYENIHAALAGNRRGLVEGDPGSCYSNGSMPGAVATDDADLVAVLRRVSACIMLTRKPLPWEEVMQVYRRPDDLAPGFRVVGDIAVNAQRERLLLQRLRSPGVED